MAEPQQPPLEELIFRAGQSRPAGPGVDLAELISAWYHEAVARAARTQRPPPPAPAPPRRPQA